MEYILRKTDIELLRRYLIKNNPGVVEQRTIAKMLKKKLEKPALFSYLKILSESKNWICRSLTCCLIPYCFQKHKKESKEFILNLANDTDWRVRENTAWALYQLLEKNFEGIYPLLKKWIADENKNVRRAVIIAAMKIARHRDEKLVISLFELIEPSLGDEDNYVQRALAFAIGDGFIRYYPTYSFPYLEKLVKRNDVKVDHLVAMSLSTGEAARQMKNSLKILKLLFFKNKVDIQNAVIKTLRKLAKRKPKEVYLEIEIWQKDLIQKLS